MNLLGETGRFNVPSCRGINRLGHGKYVDIVGVGSSILPAPTIQINNLQRKYEVPGGCDEPDRVLCATLRPISHRRTPMSEREEIPEDVWKAARSIAKEAIYNGGVEWAADDIARAIMAERGRCARIADKIAADDREEAEARAGEKDFHTANHWNAEASGCEEVAREIREGTIP